MCDVIDKCSSKEDWRELGGHCYVKILIIGGLFCWLFHNEISSIVGKWVNDPSWSHGFLIPAFSLYFINQHKHELLNLRSRPFYPGVFFLIFGILFYFFNLVVLQYGYFSPLCMIGTLGAVVLFLGGWGMIRYMWLPIVYLIFAVPLPEGYYRQITMPMRQIAATVATGLLNLVNGINANVSGVIIDVVYKGERVEPALNVADACSGMRLLMAFLALGVAMAYLHYRPTWQRMVLLATTVPIAIFCNIVRVTVTGFIYILLDPKYAQGIYHDGLGMLMLPLAFGLYGLIACFMSRLFVDESEEVEAADIVVRRGK